jgi:hypothetical protein
VSQPLELFLVGHPAKLGGGGTAARTFAVAKPATRNDLVPATCTRQASWPPMRAMADLLCLCAIDSVADEVKDAPMSLDWSGTLKSSNISSSR